MNAQAHPFQNWMQDGQFCDVRFFPSNPSVSSATDLLDEAYRAVKAYEHGKTVPYEDNVVEQSSSN